MGEVEPDADLRSPGTRGRAIRLTAAVALLVGYAIAAIFVYRECVQFISTGPEGTTSESTCSPPTLTSATVLVLLLLVVALLWPDISEVTVLGVSLKRQIRDAQATAEHARQSVETLRDVVQLQQTQIDATNSATATNNTHLHLPDSIGLDSDGRLLLRHQAQEARTEEPRGADIPGPTPERSDSDLKIDLINQFEELSELLGLSAARGRGRPTLEEARIRDLQRYFFDDHASRIHTVRAVRNAVAHARQPSRQDVEDALLLLSKLIPAARAQMELAHEEDPEKV